MVRQADAICSRSPLGASVLTVALALLSGCATTQTTGVARSGTSSDLYSGEPATLHATEMPVASAPEARARASIALTERDIDLALYLFVQAVNLDPSDAESLYAIGAIHQDRGNLDLAARAYGRVVDLDANNALAHQGLGITLFEAQRFDAAEESLLTAVELDPTLWRSHSTLGILADRKDRYESAIVHYTEAIEAQPGLASVRNNRGYSKYLAGDLEAAEIDFLVALRIDPNYERAWRNLGLLYAREKDYDRALSAMTNAIPRYTALNDIGFVAMLDGDYGVAQSFFQQAIIESPRHYQTAQDNLAELNRRLSSSLAAE